MLEDIGDNRVFRFNSFGNGEPVKILKQDKMGLYLYSRRINLVVGFEGGGVKSLAKILLSSR